MLAGLCGLHAMNLLVSNFAKNSLLDSALEMPVIMYVRSTVFTPSINNLLILSIT